MSTEQTKEAEETIGLANQPQSKKENTLSFIKRNPVLTTALIGILAVIAVYFWKDIQGNKQKAAIEQMAEARLLENNQTMLKLMAKPLVWSIRAEMLRGNMEQVNIFTTDLVKEKNFQFIYMIDPEGKIIVSTDKKLEGQHAKGMFEPALLQTDSVIVINNEKGMLTVAAPVMGFDKQLAVIVLSYAAPGFKGINEIVSGVTGNDKKKN